MQVTITIRNWEKFNPRSDRKSHSWFRLENSILTDPKLHGLDAAQRFIMITLFAEASKNGGDATTIYVEWLKDQLKIPAAEILKTIRELEARNILSVSGTTPAVSTGITTNVTDDTNVTLESLCDSLPAPILGTAHNKISKVQNIETVEELADSIPEAIFENWKKLYEVEYLNREIVQAFNYYVFENPRKRPKSLQSWIRKLSFWFKNGYERYQGKIRSNKPIDTDWNNVAIEILNRIQNYQGDEFWKSLGGWEATVRKATLQRLKAIPPGPWQLKNVADLLKASNVP